MLGALVAVRQSDAADWVLGAVRRLNKVSNDEVEAGMSIIADRIVPITVHARRARKDDLGIVVNGVDVSTMGARFDALYLPSPSRPEKPLAVKTLIVPTAEYADGRHIVLTTGHSVYTIALRHLVEQRAEWSWARFRSSTSDRRSGESAFAALSAASNRPRSPAIRACEQALIQRPELERERPAKEVRAIGARQRSKT